MHTIYSTWYQSPERCMKLSRYVEAQIILDYLSSHISNSVEIREIGKFLKEVKINQEMIKIIKKNRITWRQPGKISYFSLLDKRFKRGIIVIMSSSSNCFRRSQAFWYSGRLCNSSSKNWYGVILKYWQIS